MSWFDWVPQLLTIGGQIASSMNSQSANSQAGNISLGASKAATAAQTTGLQNAQNTYASSIANDRNLQAAGAPGVANEQSAIANQNVLTPAQQLALDQARKDTLTGLNSGDLRGSGRATVDAVKNVAQNVQGGFIQQNRQRADTAASALSNQYFNAGQNVNTQNANVAGAQEKVGTVQGAGLNDQGQIQSSTIVNNANTQNQTTGAAINDIGSAIAADNKKRMSSYTPQQSTSGP